MDIIWLQRLACIPYFIFFIDAQMGEVSFKSEMVTRTALVEMIWTDHIINLITAIICSLIKKPAELI